MSPPPETSRPTPDIHIVTHPSPHAADAGLVRDTLAGKEDAVARFIARMACIPRIVNARNHRLGAPLKEHDLADVVQEAAVAIWRTLRRFSGQSSLETWIYSFCEHTLMNAIRRARRGASSATDLAAGLPEGLDDGGVRRTMVFDQVYHALGQLEQDDQQMIRLRHFEELTFDAIAAQLRLAAGTIKSRYYRALSRLRRVLLAGEEGS
jgi:RNA polymerase sigma-70 factor (ECF subfamily)